MISATTTTLREKRYIDCRSGSSSVTISMNWALPTPGPTMRIGWLPVSSIIWNEPVMACHTVMSRRSMSCSIVAGRLSLASRRRCWPILMATARALMLLRISPRQRIRHHAERRRIEHQRRRVGRGDAVVEPVDPEVGDRGHIEQDGRDHHQGDGQQQQLAGQAKPTRSARSRHRLVRWPIRILIQILGRLLEVCRYHEIRPCWPSDGARLMEDATRPGAGQITDRSSAKVGCRR